MVYFPVKPSALHSNLAALTQLPKLRMSVDV